MRTCSPLFLLFFFLTACPGPQESDQPDVGTQDVTDDTHTSDTDTDSPDADSPDADVDDTRTDFSGNPCVLYEDPGPFHVGLRDETLPDGTPIAIFYPADEPSGDPASYDMRDFLPEDDRDLISDEDAPTFAFDAYIEAPISDEGPFPVILFSHGLAGYRFQSSTLLTHLASWGFVVASAEHPERNLTHILENLAPDGDQAPETFRNMLDYLHLRNEHPDSSIRFVMDLSQLATAGHSMGGGAALSLFDEPVQATLLYATAAANADTDGADLFWMAGSTDAIATSSQILSAYSNAPTPRRFLGIQGAGHLAFSDICAIGADRGGLLQIAADAGINVPPVIMVLGNDGCRDTDLPVEDTWPIIHHYSVAHLRHAFGIDLDPVGLSQATAGCYHDVTSLQWSSARE